MKYRKKPVVIQAIEFDGSFKGFKGIEGEPYTS